MIEDEILREIRQGREQFARECNYDLGEMFRVLKELEAAEAASGRTIVRRSPRPPVTPPAVVRPPVSADDSPAPNSAAAG